MYTSEGIMFGDLINVAESSYLFRYLAVADRLLGRRQHYVCCASLEKILTWLMWMAGKASTCQSLLGLLISRKNLIAVLFLIIDRSDRMAQLLDERDLGVLTSSMSLLVALVSNNHEAYWSCLPKCVKTLERLARNQDIPQEYTYYGIPSPWLQVCASLDTISLERVTNKFRIS